MSGHFTDEEMNLDQLLRKKIDESRCDDAAFFRAAYYKRYLKEYNCLRDVQEWKAVGTIPDYVLHFIL